MAVNSLLSFVAFHDSLVCIRGERAIGVGGRLCRRVKRSGGRIAAGGDVVKGVGDNRVDF